LPEQPPDPGGPIAPHRQTVFKRIATFFRERPRVGLAVLTAAWIGAAAAGLTVLWRYDNTPGQLATAPERWPSTTALERAADGPTVVMLAHPHCACTRSSLGELAEAIARAPRPPRTYVLFMTPSAFASGWETTDLWRSAASLPGAVVVRDEDGHEAHQFGALTSGQTLVYDEDGRLAFSGGVTAARAHPGDNPGRQALVALFNRASPVQRDTKVFGCSLFSDDRGSTD
jgi:hypothetical protein